MARVLDARARAAPENEGSGVAVRLVGVRKAFGETVALERVDLEVRDGEFFSLLGPSGSGKTTCLRLIAGFEAPTEGRVLLQDRDVTDLPPYERDVNTVFQDYALFPHMTVEENVGYGLKVKGIKGAAKAERVAEALRMVRLDTFGRRKPSALSGGQRQRVALARALVNHPKVLLLDEPLGALDLKLRQQMQVELKAIQQRVGITFIYVTHDQEEALTMSDRLGVMNEGRLEQVGTPREVYDDPASEFVAGFVGVSNVLPRRVARTLTGIDGVVALRPESIHIAEPGAPGSDDAVTVVGVVTNVVFLGSQIRVAVDVGDGTTLLVLRPSASASDRPDVLIGSEVQLTWKHADNRKLADRDPGGGSDALGKGGT